MQGTHCAEIASRSSSFRKTNFASDHAVADRLWEPKTVIFDKAALLTESRNLATLSDVGIMATAANAHKVLDTCTTRKLGSASMADAAKELNRATSAITIIPKPMSCLQFLVHQIGAVAVAQLGKWKPKTSDPAMPVVPTTKPCGTRFVLVLGQSLYGSSHKTYSSMTCCAPATLQTLSWCLKCAAACTLQCCEGIRQLRHP